MGRGDYMSGTQVLNVSGHGLGIKVERDTNRKMDSTKSIWRETKSLSGWVKTIISTLRK